MDKSLSKFFLILGFSSNESPSREDLKKRWKDLCRKHHPDVGGKEEEFLKITHAYDMITDPSYRDRHFTEEMRRSQHNAAGDLNIRIQVPVSFEDAFFGKEMVVSFNRIEMDNEFKPIPKTELDVVAVPFTVPPGSVSGFSTIVPGMGHKVNDVYGDLHVLVMPLKHAKFTPSGQDILSTEKVPLDILLKGGKVEVLTMWGMKTLRVPPATAPGTRLLIREAGVMRVGNHVAVMEAIYPSRDDLKKETWGFDINWEEVEKEDEEEKSLRDAAKRFSSKVIAYTVKGFTVEG